MFEYSSIGTEGDLNTSFISFCECGFDFRPNLKCFWYNERRIVSRFFCGVAH